MEVLVGKNYPEISNFPLPRVIPLKMSYYPQVSHHFCHRLFHKTTMKWAVDLISAPASTPLWMEEILHQLSDRWFIPLFWRVSTIRLVVRDFAHDTAPLSKTCSWKLLHPHWPWRKARGKLLKSGPQFHWEILCAFFPLGVYKSCV